MEALKEYEQYRDLTAPFRGRKEVLSNVYFLPRAIREEIAAGRLFVQSEGDSLFLFQKEETFCRLYFYTTAASAAHSRPQCPLPMVAELPFGETMDEKTEAQRDILLSWGFRLGRESGRMSAAPGELRCAEKPVPSIGEADPAEADEVYRMLYEAFDPLYAFLPDREQLLEDIEAGHVLVSRADGRVRGLLRFDQGKNYTTASQLVVAPESRGAGIATGLMEEFHRRCRQTARFWHWVDLSNRLSISLHQKQGYAFDGRHANEYIRP